jgi:hypothetical protein
LAAKDPTALTAHGRKLEKQYANQLKALKMEIFKALPVVNQARKAG